MSLDFIVNNLKKHETERGIKEYNSLSRIQKAKLREELVPHLVGAVNGIDLVELFLRTSEIDTKNFDETRKTRIMEIIKEYFVNPSKPSLEIWNKFGRNNLKYERLLEDYEAIKRFKIVQDLLVYDSPYSRIIGNIKEQLMFPDNLEKIFSKSDVTIPFAVEFHPSTTCDSHCKECPNIGKDGNFCRYTGVGKPMDDKKIKRLIDLVNELGIRRISFAGGGEPLLYPGIIDCIEYAKKSNPKLNMGLYTNGIKLGELGDGELERLASSINRIRFSLDATNRKDWENYKRVEGTRFDEILRAFERIKIIKNTNSSCLKLGASYISRSGVPAEDLERFIDLCSGMELDFCDIKDCCNVVCENREYGKNNTTQGEIVETLERIMEKFRNGYYGDMHIIFDNSFISQFYFKKFGIRREPINVPTRCWMTRANRKLTIGPYGEIYPCSDSANPGVLKILNNEPRIGILTEFEDPNRLKEQFLEFLRQSSQKRDSFYPPFHPYCVSSNMDYNIALEKLFVDWDSGIPLTSQPISPGNFDYLDYRGIK